MELITAKTIEPHNVTYGVHLNMPAHIYHQSDGVNATFLKALGTTTPLHIHEGDPKNFAQATADFGTAVHSGYLEPHEDIVDWAPFLTRTGKAFKEAHAEKAAEGRVLLTEPEHERYLGAVAALHSNKDMAWLRDMDGTQTEVSMFVHDPLFDMQYKTRADIIHPEKGYLVDVKTTTSADPRNFQKAIFDYGYHIQMAFYAYVSGLAGYEVDTLAIFAVEKTQPHATHIYRFSDELKEYANQEMFRLLQLARDDIDSEKPTTGWPTYTEVTLPRWLKIKQEEKEQNNVI